MTQYDTSVDLESSVPTVRVQEPTTITYQTIREVCGLSLQIRQMTERYVITTAMMRLVKGS